MVAPTPVEPDMATAPPKLYITDESSASTSISPCEDSPSSDPSPSISSEGDVPDRIRVLFPTCAFTLFLTTSVSMTPDTAVVAAPLAPIPSIRISSPPKALITIPLRRFWRLEVRIPAWLPAFSAKAVISALFPAPAWTSFLKTPVTIVAPTPVPPEREALAAAR